MSTTCEYFGARTHKRTKQVTCQKCKQQNVSLFLKKCTYETNVLLSTSIDVDKYGKTVFVPPTGNVPNDKLMVEA